MTYIARYNFSAEHSTSTQTTYFLNDKMKKQKESKEKYATLVWLTPSLTCSILVWETLH